MSRSDRTETRCGVTRVRCEGQPFESMLEERSLFTCGRNTINTQVPSDTFRRGARAVHRRAAAAGAAPGVGVGGRGRGRAVCSASGPDRAGSAGGRSVGRPRAADRPCPSGRSGPGALSRTVQVRLETSLRAGARRNGVRCLVDFLPQFMCRKLPLESSDVSYYTGTRHGGSVQSYEISRSAQVTPHRCRAPRALRSRLEAKRPKSVRSMPFF